MAERDKRGFLWDIVTAAGRIGDFLHDKAFADYEGDLLLRSAVERQLAIIGEALAQGIRHHPELEREITDARAVVAFRNQLVHGYMRVNNATVWDIIENDLPRLMAEAEALLAELEGGG